MGGEAGEGRSSAGMGVGEGTEKVPTRAKEWGGETTILSGGKKRKPGKRNLGKKDVKGGEQINSKKGA